MEPLFCYYSFCLFREDLLGWVSSLSGTTNPDEANAMSLKPKIWYSSRAWGHIRETFRHSRPDMSKIQNSDLPARIGHNSRRQQQDSEPSTLYGTATGGTSDSDSTHCLAIDWGDLNPPRRSAVSGVLNPILVYARLKSNQRLDPRGNSPTHLVQGIAWQIGFGTTFPTQLRDNLGRHGPKVERGTR